MHDTLCLGRHVARTEFAERFGWQHRACTFSIERAHTSSDIVAYVCVCVFACDDGKLHSAAAAHLNAGHRRTITWPPDVASFGRVRFRFRSASHGRSLNGTVQFSLDAPHIQFRTGV